MVHDRLLTLSRGGTSGSVGLDTLTGVDSALTAFLVDLRAKQGRSYVLLYVAGAARAHPPLGVEPCAPEAGLVWAEFNAEMVATRLQGFRTESCRDILRQSDPSAGPPTPFRGVVNLSFDEMPGARRHNLVYRLRQPERGIREAVQP